MRFHVETAIKAVRGEIGTLEALCRQAEYAMDEADDLAQSAFKAETHQKIQRIFGDSVAQAAARLNKTGTGVKARA